MKVIYLFKNRLAIFIALSFIFLAACGEKQADSAPTASPIETAAASAIVTTQEISIASTPAAESAAPEKKEIPSPQADNYKTDPVPSDKPQPVEPQNVKADKKQELYCNISIGCGTILNNLDRFNKDKLEILPPDGVILAGRQILFYEGESVFNVLQRETKLNKIHMEFSSTPVYNSKYIEGIFNIYEFDCGELSGWMYKVNGWFPNYGCSRYKLKEGDKIEILFTCDLGRDIGNDKTDNFEGQKQ